MSSFFKNIFKKNIQIEPYQLENKNNSEFEFWAEQINLIQKWYSGELMVHYEEKSPSMESKIIDAENYKDNAILTWIKIHQQQKYLDDLYLNKSSFDGLRILDIGSGPMASASVFENATVYCLDPLLPDYIKVGFPIHYFNNVRMIYGYSENMPFPDDFFDAVISVNAIDHVNDFEKTIEEVRRVIKPKGKLRFHIHYHLQTVCEPIELNDKIINRSFNWSKNFKKISESKTKRGHTLTNSNESYALWSNF